MADPKEGKGGTFYVPFPVLALASDGGDVFCTAGGGGSTSNKEVPNVVHAQTYIEATGKLSTVAALNTEKSLVVSLSYCSANNLWLASSKNGCKILSLDLKENEIKELCEWSTEEDGKEPEQNIARFSPDGSLIVTGGTDGQVKVYTAQKTPEKPVFKQKCGEKTKEILDVDFSPDGASVVACDGAGACRIFDISKEDSKECKEIVYTSPAVKGKVFVKLVRFYKKEDGKVVLVLGANGGRGPAVVGLFDLEGNKLTEVVVDKQPIKSMAISKDGSRLLIGLMSGAKAVYSCPQMKLIQKTKELHSLPAQGVAFVGQSTAVSGSGDRDLHILKITPAGNFFYVVLSFLVVIAFLASVLTNKDVLKALGQGEL
mmetsp:Transcript_96580/g.201827  ORF Transcript_96580/g.201827 Transcript_96580/m.201827 type:complete len:372 (-) Transcript_96580:65-1180(-)|eukprot:CAMPEP_0206458410 /NCGR_PEP_ID=MMETSP0324_2-20121206/23551_1 /ASSEMBLY_ACC=CAM_ASM_000836 /TAXON_ID=2866 /ORGANISM="Crypthecodinium cohnii, Strain Seligo" /LENGTH=371 /DNA_ID=CAMNT_0053929739 /DNA_START=193 /DNA_END=1308 /DNA_ORIENTATION=-